MAPHRYSPLEAEWNRLPCQMDLAFRVMALYTYGPA